MLFEHGGEMGARIRALTPTAASGLGAPASWPRSLTTAVSLLLASRYPMFLWWGPELANFYNDAYASILGARHPDALGRPAREVWPEIWADLAPLVDSVLGRGEATWNENFLLLVERNGYPEETYFTFSYSPAPDDGGGIGGLFCACTEETQRVLGERRLRTLRELVAAGAGASTVTHACAAAARALAGNPHDVPFAGVYLADAAGREARRIAFVGVDEDRLPGVVDLEGDDDGRWPFAAVTRSRAPVIVDGDAARRLGDLPGGPWPEPCRRIGLLPIAPSGREQAIGVLVAGISPRRPLDDDYRDFLKLVATSIGNLVAGATAHEETAARARALAELDRAKTAFFANISHEFRTPLTLMLGPTADALASPDRALRGADLETVHRNELRLLKLVNSLLDFARAEAGRATARVRPTDLAALTRDVASAFRATIEAGGLRLHVDCPPLPAPVPVDPDQWERVVLNLLSNAFKFTLEGEITVRLRAADGAAVLEVRDTGVGIPQDELPRMFERFHRVESTRARTHEGTGIGLALVRDVVSLHGGSVAVESQLGAGSTFRVTIPLASATGAQEALELRPTHAAAFVAEASRWLPDGHAAPAQADDDGPRVLVADDNADMREYVVRLLGPLGRVEAVGDGEQALRAARRDVPDLVVTDVMMPGLDGFALLRALRSDPTTARVRVIVLSARAGEDARLEGLDIGADDYLVKPFSARELLARARTQLELARLRRIERLEREALRLREEHFRELADGAPAILWTTDPTGACTYLSKRWFEFTGRRPGEDLGLGWLDNVHPDDAPQARTVFLAANERRAPFELEHRLRRVDGEFRWVVDAGLPRFDDEGAFLGFVGCVVDVHARKLNEQALEDADRRKDEFLAMLGHELRNPLAPMVTSIELLRRRGVSGRQLDVLARQTSTLSRIVDDLLDVSRITRNKIELRRERVDVAQVISRALDGVDELVTRRGHEVSVSTPPSAAYVLADPVRLDQVVVNLLTNAAKYTDPGGRIQVTVERRGDHVELSVRDDGRGIDPAVLPRVFELFEQAPADIARSAGGLGIGLTIVKSLVALHGGSVEARSDGLGAGSTFVVRLPLAPEAGVGAADEPAPAPRAALPHGRRLRLLVVDDNVDAAESLAEVLADEGHEVRTVHDGLQALDAAADWAPDVVFLDLGLPRLDGYEVARRLRGSGRPVRLVAVTGYGQVADQRRTADAGFEHHLVKPPQASAILRVLEAHAC